MKNKKSRATNPKIEFVKKAKLKAAVHNKIPKVTGIADKFAGEAPLGMAVRQTTEWGFPKGRVARTLRGILGPELSDHEVEGVVVSLMSHILLERRLNRVIYDWLRPDAPIPPEDKKQKKAEDELWSAITKMDFAKKASLIHPHFSVWFPTEASNIWKLNDLRNDIFHGRKAISDITFDGKSLKTEEGVEKIFLSAQFTFMQLSKFSEMVDSPHAKAERWMARLKELGESVW